MPRHKLKTENLIIMDRREALKSMGVGAAAAVYSGSILALLNGCKSDAAKNLAWKPELFDMRQALAVKKALDVILPTTESSPGAVELGVPRFLDKFASNVSSPEEQEQLKAAANQFIAQLEKNSGKKLEDATNEDFLAIVKKNFEGKDNRDGAYEFLQQVRSSGVWAWKNSKRIGEHYYFYDPVPGKFVGCRPLDAEGDGKLASL